MPLPPRIVVGIATREWTTVDAGQTWSEGPRAAAPGGERFDEIALGTDGVGLACTTEATDDPDRPRNARLFLTRDGGRTWARVDPRLPMIGRLRAGAGWPPEAIESLAVQPGGLLAFAWEDPWLFDGARTHLVASDDGGASWRWAKLAPGCYRLARSQDGVLRAFGFGIFCRSDDAGRSVREERFSIDWPGLPAHPDRALGLLRDVHVTTPVDAVALTVCVDADLPRPRIGLAASEDGGKSWRVVREWDAPAGDVHAGGNLSLQISLAAPQTRSGTQ